MFLAFIFSVGGLVVCVLAGVAWLTIRPASSAARKWLATVAIVYGLASLRIVGYALSRPLVVGLRPFAAADAPEKLDAVVLLGATFAIQGRDREIGLATMAGTTRVLEAARVYRELGSPWVISSGGPGHGPDPVAESLPMRDALIQLGVPASRILLESMSLSTHDEAVAIAQMLRPLHIDAFALVTSDTHMRRALATFRAQGLRPVPAIARDPAASQIRSAWFAPTQHGLDDTEAAVHEYLGFVYYAAHGRLKF